ncbi:hypothetical protein A0H81_12834 [Grifola frondosa]|uniref:GLTSCR protein conserved domain-containing protein n=1 Tax=Grifola frondosa TaxID=5627 RepID=A0A1C7LRG0_GRIFR|nr:hypothetical protein A0H81_12834 [Grifola frondosa]
MATYSDAPGYIELHARHRDRCRASSAAQSTNGVVSRPNRTMDMDALHARVAKRRKTKDRTPEEASAMLETATGIAASLAADHIAVLYPDVDTPFTDAVDAVTRLLPYHVFHQPKEDLDAQTNSQHASSYRKGKRKATEEDLIREEIAETKFALECWRRRRALEERFRKARIRSGKRPSPDDQAYVLAQAVLDSERTETASLNAELRNARAELDRLEREKRLAAHLRHRLPLARSQHTIRKPRHLPRPYGTSQYTYNPHAYSATPMPYGSTPVGAYAATPPYTPVTPTPTYTPPATTTTTTSAASAQVQQAQSSTSTVPNTTAVPVQLPASSLPALSALGIVPVPSHPSLEGNPAQQQC